MIKESDQDLLKLYTSEVAQIPMPTPEETKALAEKVQSARALETEVTNWLTNRFGRKPHPTEIEAEIEADLELADIKNQGEAAFQRLWEGHLRLVVFKARDFLDRGLTFLDLIQEGNLAMRTIIENYKPSRGFEFSTYAGLALDRRLDRAVRTHSSPLSQPINTIDYVKEIEEVEMQLEASGINPLPEKVAQILHTKVDRIIALRAALKPTHSLSGINKTDPTENVEEIVLLNNLKNEVFSIILNSEDLSVNQKEILISYFGLGDGQTGKTVPELGKLLRLSKRAVNEQIDSILKRLKIPNSPLHRLFEDYFNS